MAGKKRWQIAQWFELKWWKSYLKSKEKEQYYEWKRSYWQMVLNKALGLAGRELMPPEGAPVLDAGSGPAGMFTLLNDYRVTALDPLMERYIQELSLFTPTDFPWVEFKSGMLEEITEEDTYQLVCCLNVINHVRDIELSLSRLFDATQSGAYLLLSVDVHRIPQLKYLFRALPGDVLHPQQHSLKDYQKLLPKAGWQIIGNTLVRHEGLFSHQLFVCKKP